MRIAIGSDHLGFALKGVLITALEGDGHVMLDLGAFSPEPVDYPDYARVVGQAVLRGFVDTGVLVCGSGVGAAIAANKIGGIRAAVCSDAATARESREQENVNVLCLTARALDGAAAIEVARAWVGTGFSDDEAHVRRVAKLTQIEAGLLGSDREPGRPVSPETAARATGPARSLPVPPREPASAPPPSREPEATPTAAGAVAAPPGAHRDALTLPLVEETLQFLESQDFLDRLWVKDTSLWRGESDAVRNRLGWLTSSAVMRGHVDELRTFADEIRRLQFSQIVLLGMGGAARAAEVFSSTFRPKMGFPDLYVLDSTDPAAIKQTLDNVTLSRALFVVASKSGTTAETLALYAFARGRVDAARTPKPGLQFVAITDPGAPIERLAMEAGFRRTFLNSPSIGGRYSALSFFGLVPAALTGTDIKALLERAQAMVELSGTGAGARDNPAVRLGAALAGLAGVGRDKVTFVLSEQIRALGPWLEHLLAESLGKDGKGLVPVVDEPLGNPVVYGGDRVFVALTLEGDGSFDAALDTLDHAGHPVIRIGLKDPLDVGAEFFRWEMATATAGAVLGVNPFDEPDGARTSEYTAALLSAWRKTSRFPEWPVEAEDGGVAIMTRSAAPATSVGDGLAAHLAQAEADDYLAIMAYLPPTTDTWNRLQALRVLLRDRLRVATTLGYGPQYLHSTGQLHKGGRPNGLFIQIIGEDKDDLAIPGADYGFSTLKAAQALADLQVLREAGRRIIRVRLAGKPTQGLQHLLQIARVATRKL